MKRRLISASLATAFCAWIPAACGDTQGNVIERAVQPTDGGGGGAAACATPGGCAETGTPPAGECSKNSDCTDPVKQLCNTTLHTCAECVVNGDCTDPRETCSIALNRCAAPCSSDADCLPDDPVCDLALGRAGTPGYCVGCRQVADCASKPDRPFCVEGDCVACADGQC